MLRQISVLALVTTLCMGCASVPTESVESSNTAKRFDPPSPGKSGLYIYRDFGVGGSLKKDIWVDGKCIGETAQNVFFYEEVEGDQEHTISTESEFSPNALTLRTADGQNYFIEQYIKMGVFFGGANLKLVDEAEGKQKVSSLQMATKGTCSQ